MSRIEFASEQYAPLEFNQLTQGNREISEVVSVLALDNLTPKLSKLHGRTRRPYYVPIHMSAKLETQSDRATIRQGVEIYAPFVIDATRPFAFRLGLRTEYSGEVKKVGSFTSSQYGGIERLGYIFTEGKLIDIIDVKDPTTEEVTAIAKHVASMFGQGESAYSVDRTGAIDFRPTRYEDLSKLGRIARHTGWEFTRPLDQSVFKRPLTFPAHNEVTGGY